MKVDEFEKLMKRILVWLLLSDRLSEKGRNCVKQSEAEWKICGEKRRKRERKLLQCEWRRGGVASARNAAKAFSSSQKLV